jgi:deazaflavin-dependent oxidoreductase (nitroreductase family)
MTTGTTRGSKPKGITRLFLRFPIWLYRFRLGWLFGNRFLMFRHIGRKSGLPRYTVVEVVQHDPTTNTYIIASGWGEKADWLQNIQKEPTVQLYVGRRQWPARATRLSTNDGAAALKDYAQRHPASFRQLTKMMIGQELAGDEAGCQQLAQVVPVVTLTQN